MFFGSQQRFLGYLLITVLVQLSFFAALPSTSTKAGSSSAGSTSAVHNNNYSDESTQELLNGVENEMSLSEKDFWQLESSVNGQADPVAVEEQSDNTANTVEAKLEENSPSIIEAPLELPELKEELPTETQVAKLGSKATEVEPAKEQEEQPVEAPKTVKYKIQPGDTLSGIWKHIGAPYKGAVLALKAIKQVGVSVNSIRAGETITITKDGSNDIIGLEKKLDGHRVLKLNGNSHSGYQAEIEEPVIVEKQRIISGVIENSFSLAASQEQVPYEVIDELVDMFSGRVEFRRDLQPGDSFALVYSETRTKDGNELVNAGPIKAASIMLDGEMLVAVRYVGKDGTARYFDEDGGVIGSYYLRYPLRFTRISSVFTSGRFHPILKHSRPHNGVDFAAPIGTPVRAIADGVIVMAGYTRGGGNTIKIKHGSRYSSAYLHLSRITSGLRSGKRVKRGEVIGKVGMTGLATGPHLHFSLFDHGSYVDPLKVKLPTMELDKGHNISPTYLQASLKLLKQRHNTTMLAYHDAKEKKVS